MSFDTEDEDTNVHELQSLTDDEKLILAEIFNEYDNMELLDEEIDDSCINDPTFDDIYVDKGENSCFTVDPSSQKRLHEIEVKLKELSAKRTDQQSINPNFQPDLYQPENPFDSYFNKQLQEIDNKLKRIKILDEHANKMQRKQQETLEEDPQTESTDKNNEKNSNNGSSDEYDPQKVVQDISVQQLSNEVNDTTKIVKNDSVSEISNSISLLNKTNHLT